MLRRPNAAQHDLGEDARDLLDRQSTVRSKPDSGRVAHAQNRVHHDSSSLRRYMIDYGYMQRDHGVYWRTSKPV